MGTVPMTERVVQGADCLAEGARWLVATEPRFAPALAAGPLPLRLKPQGFGTLLQAIMGQQVSTASAAAIWSRLEVAGLTDTDAVARATEDDLRACGLSRQKIRYAQALARAGIDWPALETLPTPQVIQTLTAVTGVGLWTAEIYAKFSLGRADVFAAGDLALQEGARMLFALPERPAERDLRVMAQDWSPWRSVAARALWAYYAQQKSREGIT